MSTTDTTASASFSLEGPEPILDDAESRLVGEANPLVFQAVRVSHGALRSYGSRNDYDTDPIEDSFAGVEVDRSGGELTVTWCWDHEAAVFFNNGTSDHTIHGDPVLAFRFDESEYPYLAEMFPDGTAFLPEVNVSGLPQSRFVQAGLEWLRQEVG
ncbi:hypothetical protein RBH26_20590 [Natronolimnohabitans sp. A-GB9]|uniref:hypothetical protein n=1 Tax=Natronolimnohabitans sp. A-GB9 TaxID=3069757 RepID=UPI0027AEA31F|nr:hypothetical protein [Natronolimnohabitans sp. A-GB9]MDQ2052843.1 hypothetical protein [Natronolimnohabitans sp. A-GB9]